MHPVDLWSLGVVIFEMITGAVPYKEQKGKSLLEVIQTTKVEVDALPIDGEGKALLRGLLQKDSRKRQWSILTENEWIRSSVERLNTMSGTYLLLVLA